MTKKAQVPPPGHWKHLSAHKTAGWLGEYRRMVRWHGRACEAFRREPLTESGLDDVIAFFQNCYHLRDWLQTSVDRQKLDLLFSNQEMQLCRDICNGTKHFQLDRPSIDGYFNIGREEVPHFIDGNLRSQEEWFVIASGEKFDLFALVNRCLDLWRSFLASNALLRNEDF